MLTAAIHTPANLESIVIEQRPEPSIKAGTVKVRWHALSLNFHDYAVASGMMPTEHGRIPMSDGAGEIIEVGEGVSEWQCGDRVMSLFFPDWHNGDPSQDNTSRIGGDSVDGCATEISITDPANLSRIPNNYSYTEAATLPCAALTAWRALVEVCNIKAGDSVLIEGSGGVSIFAVQLAKALGATVYATSSSEEKMERLKQLGADHVVNYRSDPLWGETIHHLSGGIDHVLDVGGGTTLEQSISAAKVNGNLVPIGILGGLEANINLTQWMLKQLRIRPIAVGSREMQNRMVDFLETADFKPIIDCCFELPQLAEAFHYQLSGQHLGKICINL